MFRGEAKVTVFWTMAGGAGTAVSQKGLVVKQNFTLVGNGGNRGWGGKCLVGAVDGIGRGGGKIGVGLGARAKADAADALQAHRVQDGQFGHVGAVGGSGCAADVGCAAVAEGDVYRGGVRVVGVVLEGHFPGDGHDLSGHDEIWSGSAGQGSKFGRGYQNVAGVGWRIAGEDEATGLVAQGVIKNEHGATGRTGWVGGLWPPF